ncbi:MAG: hypothetical protein PF487_05810, partial [Bacteroidales bacterium]|nr:hypothetical protein [Bacteroidales bacterium]
MKYEIEKRIIDFNPEVFLNNYLDEKLWKKSFTIFTYRDYTFTIKLNTIYTYDRSLAINVHGQ